MQRAWVTIEYAAARRPHVRHTTARLCAEATGQGDLRLRYFHTRFGEPGCKRCKSLPFAKRSIDDGLVHVRIEPNERAFGGCRAPLLAHFTRREPECVVRVPGMPRIDWSLLAGTLVTAQCRNNTGHGRMDALFTSSLLRAGAETPLAIYLRTHCGSDGNTEEGAKQ